MQFVGEAVRDHMITLGSNDKTVVALGIASWGCVANRSALDGEGVQTLINKLLYPPQTLFVVGILFSRCPSICASVCP